eukprot:240943_1
MDIRDRDLYDHDNIDRLDRVAPIDNLPYSMGTTASCIRRSTPEYDNNTQRPIHQPASAERPPPYYSAPVVTRDSRTLSLNIASQPILEGRPASVSSNESSRDSHTNVFNHPVNHPYTISSKDELSDTYTFDTSMEGAVYTLTPARASLNHSTADGFTQQHRCSSCSEKLSILPKYSKLCYGDGLVYALYVNLRAMDIFECRRRIQTVGISGRIGAVRDVTYHNGKIYLSDWLYSCILQLDLATGNITRLSGGEQNGLRDGKCEHALFNHPWGIDVDHRREILYIADCGNNAIRTICLRTHVVSTLVGEGRGLPLDEVQTTGESVLFRPSGITVSADGSLYVTESASVRHIRVRGRELSGRVSTVSGSALGSGPWRERRGLHRPRCVVESQDGRLVLADCGNFTIRVMCLKSQTLRTLAGDGNDMSVDGIAYHASLRWVYSLAMCPISDTLFVVQDDGSLRCVSFKCSDSYTDKTHVALLNSDICLDVPSELLKLIRQYCFR